MADVRIIEVECKCGQELARYKKVKRGTLLKMYLDMIMEDRAGIFGEKFEVGESLYCPACRKRIATIYMIHGRPAAKVNHGAIKPIRT